MSKAIGKFEVSDIQFSDLTQIYDNALSVVAVKMLLNI